jgi:general secretion pathway protein I
MTSTHVRGFTLIEVLVALAILALTFSFAYSAVSGGLGRQSDDGRAEHAVLLARSQLARVGHELALADGAIAGRDENGFSWQIAIAPYGASGGVVGHRVEVKLDWRAGRRMNHIRLETIRLGLAASGE